MRTFLFFILLIAAFSASAQMQANVSTDEDEQESLIASTKCGCADGVKHLINVAQWHYEEIIENGVINIYMYQKNSRENYLNILFDRGVVESWVIGLDLPIIKVIPSADKSTLRVNFQSDRTKLHYYLVIHYLKGKYTHHDLSSVEAD